MSSGVFYATKPSVRLPTCFPCVVTVNIIQWIRGRHFGPQVSNYGSLTIPDYDSGRSSGGVKGTKNHRATGQPTAIVMGDFNANLVIEKPTTWIGA